MADLETASINLQDDYEVPSLGVGALGCPVELHYDHDTIRLLFSNPNISKMVPSCRQNSQLQLGSVHQSLDDGNSLKTTAFDNHDVDFNQPKNRDLRNKNGDFLISYNWDFPNRPSDFTLYHGNYVRDSTKARLVQQLGSEIGKRGLFHFVFF